MDLWTIAPDWPYVDGGKDSLPPEGRATFDLMLRDREVKPGSIHITNEAMRALTMAGALDRLTSHVTGGGLTPGERTMLADHLAGGGRYVTRYKPAQMGSLAQVNPSGETFIHGLMQRAVAVAVSQGVPIPIAMASVVAWLQEPAIPHDIVIVTAADNSRTVICAEPELPKTGMPEGTVRPLTDGRMAIAQLRSPLKDIINVDWREYSKGAEVIQLDLGSDPDNPETGNGGPDAGE